jgi:hypothetical protein
MRLFVAITTIAILVSGCASLDRQAQRNLAAGETQAKQNTDTVNVAAIDAGQIQKLLSSATNNVDKGFRYQEAGKEVARDTQGEVLFVTVPTASGTIQAPLYVDWSTDVSLNSYVDLTNEVEGLVLEVGQLAGLQTDSNQVYRTTPNRNGLRLVIAKAGGSRTNYEALSALKSGQVGEKTASGIAVDAALKTEWAGRVSFLQAGGEIMVAIADKIVGRLIAEPVTTASGALQMLVENLQGKPETLTVE